MQKLWLGLWWFLQTVVTVLCAALVVVVLWGVVSRYLPGGQSRWTEELAIYLLMWTALLGAALVYREGGHLGIDTLTNLFDPATRRWAAMVAELCGLAFALLVLVWGGGSLVFENLRSGQTSPALGAQLGYVYLAAPVGGLAMAAAGLSRLVSLWRTPPETAATTGTTTSSVS